MSSAQSYVFVTGNETAGFDWIRDCEEKVVVAVKEDAIAGGDLVNNYGMALKEGFVVEWKRRRDCAACEDSGGFCGYVQSDKQMLCFCDDGSIGGGSNLCNRGK